MQASRQMASWQHHLYSESSLSWKKEVTVGAEAATRKAIGKNFIIAKYVADESGVGKL